MFVREHRRKQEEMSLSSTLFSLIQFIILCDVVVGGRVNRETSICFLYPMD